MRLVKDRVLHGTQRGGRDGAELDHDCQLPGSTRAQSLASGYWTRVEKPGRRERASSRALSQTLANEAYGLVAAIAPPLAA